MHAHVRAVARILGLALVYVLVARLGLSLGAVAGFATLVWPPTGISIAALLIFGQRAWPGIVIGAFATNALAGASVVVALGIAIGNIAEAVACTGLVTHLPRFGMTLENERTAARLGAATVALGSSAAAVAAAVLGHGRQSCEVGASGGHEPRAAYAAERHRGVLAAAPERRAGSARRGQVERTTTRRFAGIGSGLTIARNLARRMHGEVTLASEPGHGTTASVLLPAA